MAKQICFTGFSTTEKERLSQLAAANGLDVVKTVTRSLAYLVAGPNAGPSKLKTAREQDVIIIAEGQFAQFLLDGKLPVEGPANCRPSAKVERVPANDLGILGLSVYDTPIAVIDFETTGLSAGMDRVVEVSVVRREPDGHSKIVLDTLINPRRPMGATEIHGITDADVADAPAFEEVAEGVAEAISGCVLAAYNVYFDMRFFEFEMGHAGLALNPPHICLMYLRPLLGLGPRCSLGDACQLHGISCSCSHMAGDDAEAAAQLMKFYLGVMRDEGIQSFQDLSHRGTYKFLQSFDRNVCRCDSEIERWVPKRLRSRKSRGRESDRAAIVAATVVSQSRNGLVVYWDSLKAALADLEIEEGELEHLHRIVEEYGLEQDQVRMLHARAFASVITQFISDKILAQVTELRELIR